MTRGSKDHSYAGVKYLELLSNKRMRIAAIGMAHAIVYHHGMHDWIDDDYDDYFLKRIEKNEDYDEITGNLSEMLTDIDIDSLFGKAVLQWQSAVEKAVNIAKDPPKAAIVTSISVWLNDLSNIVAEIDNEKELKNYQLLTENWNKPVITTTMVQFLNTLFSEKTASVRRMHFNPTLIWYIDAVRIMNPIKTVRKGN